MRLDDTAVVVFGAGVSLFVVLLVVALLSFKNTLRDRHVRRVSPVSLVLPILALGCIAVLNNAALIGAESIEPRAALQLVFLVVIPVCVIVASACAASFLEPLMIAIVLILVPFIGDFMPYHSGPRNPVWHRGASLPEWGPVEELLMVLAVFIVPTALIGFGVHYVSRKFRARQWTWSPLRGLAWGLPCGMGAMFAVKRKMALDIAFRQDYSMVWVILGTFVVITGLAGIKRKPDSLKRASQESPADGEAPMNVMANGGGETGTQSTSERAIAQKPPMVAGAKFGLILLFLYIAFMVFMVMAANSGSYDIERMLRKIPDHIGYAVIFGMPILIGVAGLITGIQKGRPGIGVLALFTTPIGFFFALAAEDRRVGSEGPVARKRPMVSAAKFGLVALYLYVVFMALVVVQPEPMRHILRRIPDHVGYTLMFGPPILIGIAGLITGIQKGRPGIGVLALLTTPIGFFFALAAEDRRVGSEGPVAHKRPMVSGAKFGLTVICLLVTFIVSLFALGASGWHEIHQYLGIHTSEMIVFALLFGLLILIGIAGLITGIQKKRPGIGVLALLTTPIGFFFALAAEDRRART